MDALLKSKALTLQAKNLHDELLDARIRMVETQLENILERLNAMEFKGAGTEQIVEFGKDPYQITTSDDINITGILGGTTTLSGTT